MKVQILNREESFGRLNDSEFISQWRLLAKHSSEFTLIQEYELVSTWYKAYEKKFTPVLLIAEEDNELVGILPLAVSLSDGALSHAGEDQAEYNGWVCKQKYQTEFLIQSLILLKEKFNLSKWDWGWMPPHANTDWLDKSKLEKNGIYLNMSSCELPIYDLTDTDRIAKIKKSKSMKSKINRLKRSGDLNIERITNSKRAREIFPDLKKTANFRNLAAFGAMPFTTDDDSKENWHLNHLDEGGVHFTVLWQGDELLACNFGFCSDETVIIGLFTYNPVQGAHSPGNVFLIELIEFITQEGFKFLDLSPGGDPYKERFCNQHVALYKPVFSFNKINHIKTNMVTAVKNKIKEKYSYRDILAIKENLEKKYKSILNSTKSSIKKEENNLYLLESSVTDSDLVVRHQKFEDLLLYQEAKGNVSRKDIVFSALKNFERGDSLYTFVKNNKLLFFAWVSISAKRHWNSNINDQLVSVGKNALIYDVCFLGDKSDEKQLDDFLRRIITQFSVEQAELFLLKTYPITSMLMSNIGFKKTK